MKVVEMIYQVTETCQNGKERTFKKKVYTDKMFKTDEGYDELKRRGYYRVLFLKAEWKDIITV